MSLVVHNNPRAPTQRAVVDSRDSIRASLEDTGPETIACLRVMADNRRSAETSLVDMEAAERMIDFVTDHLVMQAAVLRLTQAPSPPRMAMHLLL